MKIIDAHNHIDFHGYHVDAAVRNMDENGIDMAWLLTWEAPDDEINPSMFVHKFHPDLPHMPFHRIFEACRQYPTRFVAGFCPDPRRPGAVDRLAVAHESYGVRVCGELKLRMMYDSPDAIELYRACGRFGLPVIMHLDYPIPIQDSRYPRRNYWYGGGIEALERVLEQVPDTVFIGHAPGFWGHISNDGQHLHQYYPEGPVVPGGKVGELLDRYPNLYADLSAMSALNALRRDLTFTREFLHRFQGRLLFARDNYTSHLYKFLEELKLDQTIRNKIYHENAEGLLAPTAG